MVLADLPDLTEPVIYMRNDAEIQLFAEISFGRCSSKYVGTNNK